VGVLGLEVVITVEREALAAAIKVAGLSTSPWSVAAVIGAVASSPSTVDSELSQTQLRLLCSAPFVLEVGLAHSGVLMEQRWIHDGSTAMLTHVGRDVTVADAIPLLDLLHSLAQDVGEGADHALTDDIAARDGALRVRSVYLAASTPLGGPTIEFFGHRGARSLLWRDGQDRLQTVTCEETEFLLRLLSAERTLALEVDDEPIMLSPDALAALAVQLERTSLVALLAPDGESLERLVARGTIEVEERPDALKLIELLSEPAEELELLVSTPNGSEALHCGLDNGWATVIRATADGCEISNATRDGAVARVRSVIDAIHEKALLVITHRSVASGVTTVADLVHDGERLFDPDGGDPADVLNAVLGLSNTLSSRDS